MSAKRRGRREWERIVTAWERSGLSLAEFCERRKVLPRTLIWWRWRLGKAAVPGSTKTKRPEFVEVAVVAPPVSGPESHPVAIELPGDVVIRVEREFDEETLRRVVAVLVGARRC